MVQPSGPSERGVPAPSGGHVELVIRTASSVLVGRLAPREAVTILATQTPLAIVGAEHLVRDDPDGARRYATLLRAVEGGLATVEGEGRHGDLDLVRADLAGLARALEEDGTASG